VFNEHEIDFTEKCAEFFATALRIGNTTTQMERLLSQSQEQSGALKLQEEQMRQNFEELQATQEEMQRKALEMEQRMQVLEASGIIMAEISIDGYWITVNRALSKILKLSEGELKSIPVQDILEIPGQRDVWRHVADGNTQFGVFKLRSADGRVKEIQSALSPIKNSGGVTEKFVLVATLVSPEAVLTKL